MSTAQLIASFIASVFAILAGVTFAVRYIGKRLDKWVDATIENSTVIRQLSSRVLKLEGTMISHGSRDSNRSGS